MGIRGLQTFLEQNCPQACRPVNIPLLAENHRYRLGRDANPILAVDGMGLLNFINDGLTWILGGQWKEIFLHLEEFVMKFRSLGIRLVFFFDGATVSSKRLRWIKRRIDDAQDIKRIIEMVKENGREPNKTCLKKPYMPAGLGIIMRMALKYVFDCDVRTTLRECDEELCEFARNTKECFALLGQDTDYLIYHSNVSYLSINHLDFRHMTTIAYDRLLFANYLNLRPSQLPLLACLKGNDIIDENLLRPFHENLKSNGRRSAQWGNNQHQVICLVANFLHTLSPEVDSYGPQCYYRLKEIARIVFQNEDQVALIVKALKTYGIDIVVPETEPPVIHKTLDTLFRGLVGHNQQVAKIALTNHLQCKNIPYVYSVMCGLEFEQSTPMADEMSTDLPPTALLYRPVRQRTYGLLIQPSSRTTVEEWCMYRDNPMTQPDVVGPLPLILPSGGSTSLEELWLGDSNFRRWEAFFACIGTTFDSVKLIHEIPHRLIAPCCIVNYIIQNTMIETWEVAALLAQIVHPVADNVGELMKLRVNHLTARIITISTLFMRGVTMVLHVLGVCGNPFSAEMVFPWNYFNGKLFNHCYFKARIGSSATSLCGRSNEAVRQFFTLQAVVTQGTRFEGLNLASPSFFP